MFTPAGCKDKGNGKFETEGSAQFLLYNATLSKSKVYQNTGSKR